MEHPDFLFKMLEMLCALIPIGVVAMVSFCGIHGYVTNGENKREQISKLINKWRKYEWWKGLIIAFSLFILLLMIAVSIYLSSWIDVLFNQ